MSESNSLYQFIIPVLLILLWGVFFTVSIVAHKWGLRSQHNTSFNVTDIVPVNILGLLALILGFTFSMAISRYDTRRELVVKEANALESAYLRSNLLKEIPPYNLKEMYRKYLDSRIAFYENADPAPSLEASAKIKKDIWSHLKEVTKTDRTDIAGEYTSAVNDMFETANSRNYAIEIKLPISIYLMIILIACTALGFLNFDSAYKNEKALWRNGILILLLGFVIALIFDLDHPRIGTIEISQQALIELRDLI